RRHGQRRAAAQSNRPRGRPVGPRGRAGGGDRAVRAELGDALRLLRPARGRLPSGGARAYPATPTTTTPAAVTQALARREAERGPPSTSMPSSAAKTMLSSRIGAR